MPVGYKKIFINHDLPGEEDAPLFQRGVKPREHCAALIIGKMMQSQASQDGIVALS